MEINSFSAMCTSISFATDIRKVLLDFIFEYVISIYMSLGMHMALGESSSCRFYLTGISVRAHW